MSQVSRPVQVLLAATLLFAALWFVALRPKTASTVDSAAPTAPGVEGLTNATQQAEGAADTAQADADRAGSTSADDGTSAATGGAPAAGSDSASAAQPGSGATDASQPVPFTRADAEQLRAVRRAVREHKAVAIGFVNPSAADGRAVATELANVSLYGGRALAVSAPIAQLSRYAFITSGVEVTVAPTTVIVARNRQATTIVGYADRGEIQQRLADALAVKR